MDRFQEFQGFAAVAEAGSFTGAAARLGISASAVSKQVRHLEQRLGVRLLNRTTRRVALTEEGRAFSERIRGVLTDVDEAEREASARTSELRGRLRVGAPMDFGRAHLADPIAAYAARHPGLSLDVEFADRFVDLVEEGFDVVVRIGQLADASWIARWLAPCRRLLCASPAYLSDHGVPDGPAALRGHARIGYAYESERSLRLRGPNGIERVDLPVRHRSNNGHMTRALLLEGAGIALIPTFLVAADLRSGALEPVLIDALDADIGIHAVYPHRALLSARARSFVDFLVEHCGGPTPYWDEGLPI